MKKVLAVLLAVGIILGGGVKFTVSAGDDYLDIPANVTKEGGN